MDRVRVGAIAGIAGAVLFTGGWIVAGLVQPATYDWARQEISDLGALTADHAWVWNLADSLSGLLILIFAVGILPLVRVARAGKVGAILIGIVGFGSVLDGLLREDCPLSTSDACQRLQDAPGLSWQHQAHDIESVVVFLAILAAPFFLARACTGIENLRGLRGYSVATGFVQIAAALAYAALYGQAGGGVAQRLLALAFMVWIVVLALRILTGSHAHPAGDGKANDKTRRSGSSLGEAGNHPACSRQPPLSLPGGLHQT
jgi:hypothetical membrane protein